MYRDYQNAVRESQSPTKESVVEGSGTPVEQDETGGDVGSGPGQDADAGSSEDALQVINSKEGEVAWSSQSFWTFVDYSFLTTHKSILETAGSQAEREQVWDRFVFHSFNGSLSPSSYLFF